MEQEKKSTFWIYLILVLSSLGLLDASYLTYKSLSGGGLACPLTGGCDIVTTSSYSKIAGVPIALLGVLFYLSVLILTALAIKSRDSKYHEYVVYSSFFAFLFSLYLVYVQLFVIRALCLYCMTSVLLVFLIFVSSLFLKNAISESVRRQTPS